MAKNDKQTETTQPEAMQPEATPAPDAPAVRYLRNPSGNIVPFNAEDPNFEYHLFSQRPPHVKRPEQWFTEVTAENYAAHAAKQVAKK